MIDQSKKLICIEGLIGAGKSTLTRALSELIGARAMYEPVEENPYLEKFYADPRRYALEMQFWLMSKRFSMHEEAIRHIWQTGQTVIMDRSIYGDWIFAKRNFLDGNIDSIGYANYCSHRSVMDRYLLAPHSVVWLSVNPKTCLNRISIRGRNCERTISVDYLEGLHELHSELMKEMRARGSQIEELKWDEPFQEIEPLMWKLGFTT